MSDPISHSKPGSASRQPKISALRTDDLEACREQLRNGSRTFLLASMLLPRAVHAPACALYAFCRQADDAVDGADALDASDASRGMKAISRLRHRLDRVYAGTPENTPADRALAQVVAQFRMPRLLFDAMLEGFEWDAQGRRYETADDLHAYAARVAGTVGAMMALLMGVRSRSGLARACELGVAMQLSNIARDVGEDAAMGRLYLPREWLAQAGVDADAWMRAPAFDAAIGSVVQRVLQAADGFYRQVGAGVVELPLSCRPGINAARYLYAEIGHQVARNGLDSVSRRAVVGTPRKLAVLGRALVPPLSSLVPSFGTSAVLVLPAVAFLVDAAADPHIGVEKPAPTGGRSLVDRLTWTVELFTRLEHRDRAAASFNPATLP